MNVQLHIERLILDGLPVTAAQGPRVKAAMEAELTRLLAEGGLNRELQQGGATTRLRADTIRLAPQGSPAQLGRQIAQSVYGGIGKGNG
jgi:hypothetical protein